MNPAAGQPLFSVLIANYNNGIYLEECIKSILAQTYALIEIILIDDASTDQSKIIIETYLQKEISIHYYQHQQNKGCGYTKNECISLANGQICGFVDPDDTITPNAVAAMVEAHFMHPEAALVYSNLYYCDPQLTITGEKIGEQVIQGQNSFFNEKGAISSFATFKKHKYNETKGINPTLKRAEDQDLYLKLYDVGAAVHLDKTLYYYRIHKNGMSTLAHEDAAYFWYWKVILDRATTKNIDLEAKFLETFTRKVRVRHYLSLDSKLRGSFIFPYLKKWLG